MSADDWRIVAQEGRIFDLKTVLEPDKTPRAHDPSSTPIQVTLDVILKEIRSIRDELVTFNERLDKHDKDITHLMLCVSFTHRDIDEYVDPDMFGASARPKSNPPPRFKTSPNFDESADIYED